jgi:hypothetical protein
LQPQRRHVAPEWIPITASMSTTKPAILIYFREDQRFRSPLLWVPLIVASAFLSGTTVWMIMTQVVQGKPFGEDAMSNSAMLALGGFVLLFNLLVVMFFVVAKMQVEVNSEGLFLRFFPFHRKTRCINLEGATRVSVEFYRALLEYGGWGIRRYPRATLYSTGGDHGVRIDFDNGCHIMLGTRHPEALMNALKHLLPAEEATTD